MKTIKRNSQAKNRRAIKTQTKDRGSYPAARARMHNRESFRPSATPLTTLEQEYVLYFTSTPAPHQQSFYPDEYSLAQPSALKYVDSTTSPNAEV